MMAGRSQSTPSAAARAPTRTAAAWVRGDIARSVGQPLGPALRRRMETRLGDPRPAAGRGIDYRNLEAAADLAAHGEPSAGGPRGADFSTVRLHAEGYAASAARRFGTRPITIGEHICANSAFTPSGAAERPGIASAGRPDRRCNSDSRWGGASADLGAPLMDDSASESARGSRPRGRAGAPATSARPSLWLTNDDYQDNGYRSEKEIHFNVTVPAALRPQDYCLVQKVRGHWIEPGGAYARIYHLNSLVDANFPTEVVDSWDADPVYGSNSTARWNYRVTQSGFMTTDNPGPIDHVFRPGSVIALRFRMGLYELANIPTTTTGTISATPIQEVPWQFSVVTDAPEAFKHPVL